MPQKAAGELPFVKVVFDLRCSLRAHAAAVLRSGRRPPLDLNRAANLREALKLVEGATCCLGSGCGIRYGFGQV